jgi:feruloyl esterase
MSILWSFAVSKRAPIPNAKLTMLNEAAVKACGAADGIIVNPAACHFDPANLQCPASDGERCLTAAQVETARQLYQGPTNPRTHRQLYPGLPAGSEFGWDQLAAHDSPPYAPIFQWVFGRDWDWHTFDFDRTVQPFEAKLSQSVNATNADLHAFSGKGHKLIVYHGWADWLVAPGESINFYQQVVAANQNAADFYRFFMVPGMAHCGGGPGQDRLDPLSAVVDWVEKGAAPSQLIASKPGKPQRVLCPYPQTCTAP